MMEIFDIGFYSLHAIRFPLKFSLFELSVSWCRQSETEATLDEKLFYYLPDCVRIHVCVRACDINAIKSNWVNVVRDYAICCFLRSFRFSYIAKIYVKRCTRFGIIVSFVNAASHTYTICIEIPFYAFLMHQYHSMVDINMFRRRGGKRKNVYIELIIYYSFVGSVIFCFTQTDSTPNRSRSFLECSNAS